MLRGRRPLQIKRELAGESGEPPMQRRREAMAARLACRVRLLVRPEGGSWKEQGSRGSQAAQQ